MRFFAITSALVGAALANDLEARWAVTSSSSAPATTSSCAAVTTTCTVTVTAWGGSGKGSNGTQPTPTATGHYYVNGAGTVTYGAWSVVAGIAAAMLM